MACHSPERAVGALRAAGRLGRALAICAAATASTCAVAGLASPTAHASATTLAPTKAKVAVLSADQLAAARRAHSLVAAYDAELSTVALLRSQVTDAQGALSALRSAYRSTSLVLQKEAVLFYVGAVPAEPPAGRAAQAGEFVSQVDEATYERLAVGDLSGVLERFRQEQSGIELALRNYDQDLARDLAAARLLASRRREALAQAASLEEMLARARTELAAEAVKHRAFAGPPVGRGIVAAIASQLGSAPPAVRRFAHARATLSTARSASSVPNGEATGLRLHATTSVLAPPEAPTTTSLVKATTTRPVTTTVSTTTAPTTTTTEATTTTTAATTTTTAATTTTTAATTTAPTTTTAPSSATTSPPSTTAPSTSVATTSSALTTTTQPPATPSSTPATTKLATATSTTAAAAKASTSSVSVAPSAPSRSPSSSTTTAAGASPSATGGPASTTSSTAFTGGSSSTGGHPPPAGGVWLELRQCESGDNYQENTGNGFYGAYQFAWSTWAQLGYSGRPDQAPYWVQDEAAQRLEAMEGWSPWPACSAALGL